MNLLYNSSFVWNIPSFFIFTDLLVFFLPSISSKLFSIYSALKCKFFLTSNTKQFLSGTLIGRFFLVFLIFCINLLLEASLTFYSLSCYSSRLLFYISFKIINIDYFFLPFFFGSFSISLIFSDNMASLFFIIAFFFPSSNSTCSLKTYSLIFSRNGVLAYLLIAST